VRINVEYLQDIATLAGADFKLADWEGLALSVGAQGILRGSTDEMQLGGLVSGAANFKVSSVGSKPASAGHLITGHL
jgi:hypothetical protein